MLVSQVFVISKLGGENLILYKYFLGTLRADHSSMNFCFRAKS